MANCKAQKANTRAIENLVMPEERKTMIKALAHRFTNDGTKSKGSQPWLTDHMQNKGEGQIFLLHGGPGVGKTYVKMISPHPGVVYANTVLQTAGKFHFSNPVNFFFTNLRQNVSQDIRVELSCL